MKSWKQWREHHSNPNKLIHPSGKDIHTYITKGLADANQLLLDIPDITTKKTLDYGCGNARMLRHLTQYEIYGVDLVADFIVEAQKFNNKCYLRDHLLDTDFEIVYAKSVFIHLNDEDTEEALQYIYERLTSQGLAYLQIPVYDTHTSPRDFMDVRTWEASQLLDLFDKIGFKVLELWTNPGSFNYLDVGKNHKRYQVCIKA